MRCRYLPVCLCALLPWGAVAGLSAVRRAAAAEAAPLTESPDRLANLLDDMRETRDADFMAASSYMLELTGDELAFVRRMEELAAGGHPVAMAWQGLRLQGTDGDEAFRLLQGAAEEYPPAIVWLARLMYDGWEGHAPDRNQAREVLMTACKLGSPEARALYLKWGCLSEGEADCNRAEIASELKRHNYHLEEYLADCPGQGKDWLKEASEHGSAKAAYGKFLRLAASDPEESMSYLRMAAQRHHPLAMERLGCMLYGFADPGSEEAKAGLNLLRHSAATGESPRAAALVGLAYAYCVMGQGERSSSSAPDIAQQVASLFRYAHEHGEPIGSVGWGWCLVAGKGCARDVEQGLEVLETAARALPRFGHLALYHVYAEGIGVESDERKAAEHEERFKAGSPAQPEIWIFAGRSASSPFMPGLE